jgi:hypothetical protein
MMQQVNLFQPQFRRRKTVLPARLLLQLLLVATVAMAGVYAMQRVELARVEQQLAIATAEEQTATTQVEEMRVRFPERVKSQMLENELADLQLQLDELRQLADMLTCGALGNAAGLSPYFEALARQHVEGTWLSGIEVGAGGRAVALDGHALAPEMVPLYLQQLGSEPSFAGKAFGELELTRPQDDPLRVDFFVSAGGLKRPEAAKKAGGNG